ncbi:MAG: ABC transporter permease [Deltaproteobacteria bacterium]
MRYIALRSLLFDRGKLLGALSGVAFATVLLLLQIGIYQGFISTASALIDHMGGDLWVMASGTEVIDNGEPLSAGARSIVTTPSCVTRARGVILSFGAVRKPGNALDGVQIVGFEPADPAYARAAPLVPWELARGLPSDLHAPLRVSVDSTDLGKLHLPDNPVGSVLQVNGRAVYIAAVTRGIRSFALTPFLFMELPTARRLLNLAEGQAHYWVLDLRDRSCAAATIREITSRAPDLDVRTADDFRARTQDFWVKGSGAGTALGFSALLGLVVGTVIVAQTLYALTREHEKELATLKAVGASAFELASFVGWQAVFLAVVGGTSGGAIAFATQRSLIRAGLTVVLDTEVVVVATVSVILMCAVASLASIRRVLTLEAVEVFK